MIFLDRIREKEFINHCGQASVLLDLFILVQVIVFIESMYYGTPTVTLPSNYLKARIVKGAYDQMKLENSPVLIQSTNMLIYQLKLQI